MKLDVFKKLIKEAVREVLQEELGSPNTTPIRESTQQVQHITKHYTAPTTQPTRRAGVNPLMDLLEETRLGMTNNPGAGHYSDMSQYVSAPGLGQDGHNPVMLEESFGTQEPGLDISQFDFVKKAGAIYKASVEKDKERFGV